MKFTWLPHCKEPNARFAFTLVEMLVVISIIAILSALLLPSLQSSIRIAKEIGCSNNLKQIGISYAAYSSDNNGHLPYRPGNVWRTGLCGTWLEELLEAYTGGPIIGNAAHGGIWICPDHKISVHDTNGLYTGNYYTGGSGSNSHNSYNGLFQHYNTLGYSGSNPYSFRITYHAKPSSTPVQYDGSRYWWQRSMSTSANPPGPYGGNSWHQQKGRPALFMDVHVKVLRKVEFLLDDYPGEEKMALGPYSTWELSAGRGNPAHKPWDFSLSEY